MTTCRRLLLSGLFALCTARLPSQQAHAQQTGAITGYVFDEGGVPLPGVKIIAKSPTDIAPKTVFTNDEGGFRIVGLMPGSFDVLATATGMETFVQKGLRVNTSSAAQVDVVMKVATTMTVEEIGPPETPAVDTRRAALVTHFDKIILDKMPVEDRASIQGALALIPGIVGTGDNVQFRGATTRQNVSQLDGFTVNNPDGTKGQNITTGTVASIEVKTGGNGAEHGNASGVVLNAVAKAGGNDYELELNGFHENTDMQLFKRSYDPREFGMHSFLALSLSGPIVKDRLWFFTTIEGRNNITVRPSDISGLYPQNQQPPRRSENRLRSTGKLTWQINGNHKLQFLYIANRDFDKNRIGGFQYDRDAQAGQNNLDLFGGLTWESLLSEHLVFRSQVGVQDYAFEEMPESCRDNPETCDHIAPLRQRGQGSPPYDWQNFHTHTVRNSQTLEFKNALEYYRDSKVFGNHEVKLTARFFAARREDKVSTPGDQIYVFDGVEPDSKRELFVNDPVLAPGRVGWAIGSSQSRMLHLSLQDQVTLPGYRHLTLTPGIAVFDSSAMDGNGDPVVAFTTFTPHVALAWDPTQDGKTVIRSSFNNYVDAGNLDIANYVSFNRTLRVCDWDQATQTFSANCRFSDGASSRTVGLACGPDGIAVNGKSCKQKLKVPRTWEYTAGIEREVAPGTSVSGDFQYRTYRNPYEDRETNRVWNESGTDLLPTGSYRNGRPMAIMNLETPDTAKRAYTGVIGAIHKREGKLNLNFSYQWSRLRGNVVDGFSNPYLDNAAQDVFQYGFLPGDSRHVIRAQAVYDWKPWLSTGVTYAYTSGTPVQLRYWNEVTNDYTDFRARRGFDPGRDVNDPADDFEFRTPDRQVFNLQARLNLEALTRFKAEVYIDAFNVLALRTSRDFETRVNPTFDTRIVTDREPPFRFRLGFQLKY